MEVTEANRFASVLICCGGLCGSSGLALHIQAEAPISRGLYLNIWRRLERGGRPGRVLPKVEKNDLPFLGSLTGSSGCGH